MLLVINIKPADANVSGYALNVTGDTFVLTANDAGDDLAHRVSITNNTMNDWTGITLTVVGTDYNGKPQTETIAGPAIALASDTVKYYLTLESVTPSASIGADTFNIGLTDEIATKVVALNWNQNVPSNFKVEIIGTMNISVEFTLQDHVIAFDQENILWAEGNKKLTNVFKDSDPITVKSGYTCYRVVVNSYSSGGEANIYATQAE